MSTRRPGSRAFLPHSEDLEPRKLLAKSLSGIDPNGNTWVLNLVGPGDLRVTNQPDASGNAVPLGQPAEINTIEVAGANPETTRLVGKVTKGANSTDGRVFFEHLTELGGAAEGIAASNGIYAIDMPDFWLGHTSTTAPASGAAAGQIRIPDGIVTLRFGGADTTFTPPGGTPLINSTTNQELLVDLGLPRTQGTSIIIRKSISNGKPAQGTTAAIQDGVEFHVVGRLNVFQADSIEGNAAAPTTGFVNGGGTIVFSTDGREPNSVNFTQSAITGDIGFIRVGGNATNFSVQTTTAISNYFVGGETNNIQVLSPEGMRNVYFGKGMDTATILTHTLFTLRANRGALNSDVTVERSVGNVSIGGDVVNTNFLSGYNVGLLSILTNQRAPTTTPPAQDGGALMNVLIAGDVKDSVFAASAEPLNGVFGTQDLLLPHGRVYAKVEGKINNANATPDTPNNAFFAKTVRVSTGPVIPPSVPEGPFPNAGAPPTGSRVVKGLQPTITRAPVVHQTPTRHTTTSKKKK